MNAEAPLVSIACMTYNQEKFIGHCIESMILQETDFPFEIIIHDDASRDNTAAIVQEYAAKHPRLIKPIIQTKNKLSVGVVPLSTYIFPACRGKYVAVCEGDDYWIDPKKLQRHIDFLENHDDYVMVHSGFKSVDEEGRELRTTVRSKLSFLRRQKEGFIQKDLVKGNYIMTVTTLIRRDALLEAEDRIKNDSGYCCNIDFTLFLELSRLGKFHFDKNKTAAYRVLRESASHSDDLDKRLGFIEKTVGISRHYNSKYNIGYADTYFERVKLSAELSEYAKRGLYRKFLSAYSRGVKEDWLNILNIKNYLNIAVLLFKR